MYLTRALSPKTSKGGNTVLTTFIYLIHTLMLVIWTYVVLWRCRLLWFIFKVMTTMVRNFCPCIVGFFLICSSWNRRWVGSRGVSKQTPWLGHKITEIAMLQALFVRLKIFWAQSRTGQIESKEVLISVKHMHVPCYRMPPWVMINTSVFSLCDPKNDMDVTEVTELRHLCPATKDLQWLQAMLTSQFANLVL